MKKSILTVLTSIAISMMVSAQSSTSSSQEAVKQLNFGLGLSGSGIPVYLGADFGVHPDVTLGGEISFRSYSENWNYAGFNYKYKHNVFGALFNANYHFNRLLDLNSSWDVYAGGNVGFYVYSTDYDGPSNVPYPEYSGSNSSGLGIGIQIGGRYFFNDKWGINLEFGGGNSVSGAKIGATCRF